MTLFERVSDIAQKIKTHLPKNATPKIGMVLGSGWSHYGETLMGAIKMSYADIGLPSTKVAGHKNALVYGKKFGVETLIMQGRLHHYEGYDLETVVLPTRALILCGCNVILLTNAAGGIRQGMVVGQIAVIEDHLNFFGNSPLHGPNDDRLGVRFPDMTHVYDKDLQMIAKKVGKHQQLSLTSGVYAGVRGPQYETPAEIRMFATLGADLVGMSTVPEAIAARHMGAKVLGLSLISNVAAGLSGVELSHQEVTENAALAQEKYISLLDGILSNLSVHR